MMMRKIILPPMDEVNVEVAEVDELEAWDLGGASHRHVARKQLVHIDRFDGRTIFHDMEGWYGPTKVVIRMRRAFSGTRCNWLSWKIFSAFGISDLSCRVHGSTSNINQARCIVNTLMRMDTPQLIASRRGKRVLDMTARNHANPRPALGPRTYA